MKRMRECLDATPSNLSDAQFKLPIIPSDRVSCSLDILATIAHEHAIPNNKHRKIDVLARDVPKILSDSACSSNKVNQQAQALAVEINSERLPLLKNETVIIHPPEIGNSIIQVLSPAEPAPITEVNSLTREFSHFDAIIKASLKTGLMSPPIVSAPFPKSSSSISTMKGFASVDTETAEKHAASVLIMASRNTQQVATQPSQLSPQVTSLQVFNEPVQESDEFQLPSPPADSSEVSDCDKNGLHWPSHKEACHERHLRLQQNLKYRQRLEKIGLRPIKKEDGRFYCSICDRAFNKEMFVWRHGVKHLGLKPFQCKDCLVTFGRSDSLQRHIRKFHKTLDHTGRLNFPCSKASPSKGIVEHHSTP